MSAVAAVVERAVAIATITTTRGTSAAVVRERAPVATVADGQGPAGPPGRDADAAIAEVAVIALSGHRAVRPVAGGVAYASASDPAQANTLIGVTRTAAAAGALVDLATTGEIVEEPSWTWAIGPVFLGENGALTQVAPGIGFVQRVGIAVSPTKIAVLIGPATIKG